MLHTDTYQILSAFFPRTDFLEQEHSFLPSNPIFQEVINMCKSHAHCYQSDLNQSWLYTNRFWNKYWHENYHHTIDNLTSGVQNVVAFGTIVEICNFLNKKKHLLLAIHLFKNKNSILLLNFLILVKKKKWLSIWPLMILKLNKCSWKNFSFSIFPSGNTLLRNKFQSRHWLKKQYIIQCSVDRKYFALMSSP